MYKGILAKIKRGARVGFFGIGKSTISLLLSLPLDNCEITLRSDKAINIATLPPHIKPVRVLTGADSRSAIDEEILIFSPSVRRIGDKFQEAKNKGVIFTSDAEIFLEENEKPLYAVSGSDGKSTTATILSQMIPSSRLIGNVGIPMTKELVSECSSFVAELSSFMLQYAEVRATRACITNITPNHLDWHSDFQEYAEAKLSLLKSSKEYVVNADDAICLEYAKRGDAFGIISCEMGYSDLKKLCRCENIMTLTPRGIEKNDELFIKSSEIAIKEKHNIKNLMMACLMAAGEANDEQMRAVARSFCGLAHRCERFCVLDGAEYINSSIDSTPARVVQTLTSLGRRVIILLGGRGKGTGYSALCDAIKEYAEYALIYGENRYEIYEAIKGCTKCEIFDSLGEAAHRSTELLAEGKTVLLSPASTSYDAFRSFEERGNYFKKIIMAKQK